MAITVPQPGNDIDAVAFGQPVANQLNALVPTVWYNPVFQNSWSAYTGASSQGTQYRKIGDIVYVRGNMQGGANTSIALTLPTGFRPPLQIFITCLQQGGTMGYLTLNNLGQLTVWAANTGQISTEFVFSTTP